MSDAVDISDGDTVQTPRGRGQVVKRQGVRVRVEYSDGIKWEEIKNVERVAGTKEVFSAADGRAEAEGGDAVAAIAGDLFRVIDKDRSGSIDRHEFISFLLVTSDHTRIGEWWALLSEHARQAQGPRVGKAASSGGGITEAAFKSWASANPQHLEEISRLHQASKVRGPQGYDVGQRLLVILPEGSLADATVVSKAGEGGRALKLQLSDGREVELELHTGNHCLQRLASAIAYRSAAASFGEHLAKITGTVEDGITCARLRTRDQLLAIGVSASGVQSPGLSDVASIRALAKPLLDSSPERSQGVHKAQLLLLCAEAGTGKTWAAIQLTNELAEAAMQCAIAGGTPLVPVLIYVQRLSRMLEGHSPALPLDESTLLQYFANEYAEHPEWLSMLAMALEMRTLVLVIDGIDEAAGRRTTISKFIREGLAPAGHRIVCTSRPEGVRKSAFASAFVIFDLQPLSPEQQQKAVESQLALIPYGQTFGDHLLKFSEIRNELDRIYSEVAFPSAEERARIESFAVPNRQFINGVEGGERDPSMRQKTAGGAFVAVSGDPTPRSRYFRELSSSGLTQEKLVAIDAVLANASSDEKEEAIKERVHQLFSGHDAEAAPVKVGQKLALLVLKRRKALDPAAAPPTSAAGKRALAYLRKHVPQTTAATLWPRIVARTDRFYEAIEDLLDVFTAVMHALADKMGIDRKDLKLAETVKDAVRMHEKACDDYVHDFNDWEDATVIPESCVIDMIRGRVSAGIGRVMLALMSELERGLEVEVDGEAATLSLLRCKNKFANGGRNEPTRFRNMTANAILSHGGRTVVVELQIHHTAILDYNDRAHAHDHFNFFRALFASAYEEELDAMLEQAITFLEQVRGVPVLLSMLVLIFKTREAGSTQQLPASLLELYRMATHLAIREQVAAALPDAGSAAIEEKVDRVRGMLSRIACANHMAKRREFTSVEAESALQGGVLAQLKEWNALVRQETGVPLIKILVDAGGGKEGSYQFRHLSFQEGLLAINVVQGDDRVSLLKEKPPWKPFQDDREWFANAIAIGGDEMGAAVCAKAKAMGCASTEAKAAGYSFDEVRRGGYSLQEMRKGGYTVEELAGVLRELKAGGMTCQEAKVAGFNPRECQQAGFTWQEVKTAGYLSGSYFDDEQRQRWWELRQGSYTAEEISGVLRELKTGGMTCKEAEAAGFTCEEAKAAGFNSRECMQAGFTWQEGKAAGYISRAHDVGFRRQYWETGERDWNGSRL